MTGSLCRYFRSLRHYDAKDECEGLHCSFAVPDGIL